jgi:hypothetical protein
VAIAGIITLAGTMFFIPQVIVQLTLQNGLYAAFLELAQKGVKFFSCFELLEKFFA